MTKTYTIEELRKKDLIIFEAIMGSKAFGTSLPTSDTDIRGVFMQPIDDILEYGYVEQVSDKTNDIVFYELKRFISLAISNNPSILELLFAPEDCILEISEIWKILRFHCHSFLSKKCRHTFAGYAINQIKKAKGYNKKINWEESKMIRKDVLDFCYILEDEKTISLNDWYKKMYTSNYKYNSNRTIWQSKFGLAKVNHAHNIYAMYDLNPYDLKMSKGIVSTKVLIPNDVQLTSIPKGQKVVAHLIFNKDAYSTHCKRFKEYQIWLKERNEDRFKMNKEHGKNYDSKNMSHTFRLLNVALEIAETGHLKVRRSDAEIEILMKIRRGEYEYDDLLKESEELISKLDKAYDKSNLPEKVNEKFVNQLLLVLRKERNDSI